MTIKIGDHIIKTSEGILKFDLFKLKKFKSGRTTERNESWGISFERAMQMIALDRVDQIPGELDLPHFVAEYQKITNNLIKEANEIVDNLK